MDVRQPCPGALRSERDECDGADDERHREATRAVDRSPDAFTREDVQRPEEPRA